MVADPRLLLIDMTSMLGSAATSTLKHAYFADWRQDALLHLQAGVPGMVAMSAGAAPSGQMEPDLDKARAIVDAFKPQVILYRPVADRPELHDVAMAAIKASDAPLALWLMDDWPARLEAEDPQRFAIIDRQLRTLFERSSVNFAISQGMADAFSERYGVVFKVAHNGVRINELPQRRREKKGPLRIRYAGSLAPDTTKETVLAVAQVVSRLAAKDQNIVFEGRTQPLWLESFGDEFNKLPAVSMSPSDMSQEDYRQWLADADILLIAYNFDEATRCYLRYSFANKTPETLGAGAAVLAVGPRDLETIAFLENSGVVETVTDLQDNQIEAALFALARDPERRQSMAVQARQFAIEHFDIDQQKSEMRRILCDLALPMPDVIEEQKREAKAQFDECGFVYHLLNAQDQLGMMVDVGAHSGGSLAPFAKAGWTVWAFEPDTQNRKRLTAQFGDVANVNISPKAVGRQIAEKVSFYRSDISTGISGLSAFHESHEKTTPVDVTTLNQVVDENNISLIDFLKIDVEGHEMDVLDGFDLKSMRPRAIVAEFEDGKTRAHGFVMTDLADRFVEVGYVVFVSEWHPIEQYGVKHSWRQLRRYPYEPAPNAWGNLIALTKDPDDALLAFAHCVASKGGSMGEGAEATVDAYAPRPASGSFYRRTANYIVERWPFALKLARGPVGLLRRLVRRGQP